MADPALQRVRVMAVLEPQVGSPLPDADVVVVVDALGPGSAVVQAIDHAGGNGVVDLPGVAGGDWLAQVATRLVERDGPVVLGCLCNARPAMSMVARLVVATRQVKPAVLFVAVGADGRLAVEDAYACGVLARVLLDELGVPTELDDAAGIAVAMTEAYPDHASALSAGIAGRTLVAGGGSGPALLAAAAQQDVVGCVPRLLVEDGIVVARA